MSNNVRFSRGGVLAQALGISSLIALLFLAGCGANSTPTPVLTITKTHTGNFAQGQQNATYTVTVANTGKAASSGTVTVTDTVPSGETLVSVAGTGWTCAAGATNCTRADALAAAASYPTITVTVNVSASAASPQVNQVSVAGGGAANASGQDSTVINVPVLTVTKTHTGNFTQGQVNATYTVTVANTGAASTNGTTVTVTDTVPTGETLVSMVGTGWTCPVAGTTCTRSDALAAASSYPAITATVNVAANAGTPQVNAVSVSGGGAANANGQDSTIIDEPVLSITKTHTGNFTQGQQNATYTVTVQNTGTLPTTAAVEVMDTLPSGETLVSMAGTGWTCPGAGGANTCDRSDVLSNGTSYPTITVTVNVTASATSPQVNQVNVTGGGSATGNGSDSTTIGSSGSSDPCAGAGTGSESLLNGSYAFTQTGFDNGQASGETQPEPALIGGVLTLNGAGTVSNGSLDMNLNAGFDTANSGSAISVTSGTYKVGSDHRACMGLTTSAGTLHYQISLGGISSNVASTGHMINIDAAGPFTAGTMVKQSGTIPTSLSGNYAFGISSPQNSANTNNSISGGKFAAAGVIDFTSGTTFNQTLDFNQNGQLDGSSSNTAWASTTPVSVTGGTYSVASNGRGTFTFTPPGSSNAVHAILYVVSTSETFILNADAQNANSAFAGIALQQSGPFSSISVSGTSVLYLSSLQINGGSTPSNSDVQIGTLTTTSGSLSFNSWDINPGNTPAISPQSGSGNVTVASNGRVTFSSGGGNHPPEFWLVTANEGFLLGGSQGVETGMIEPQTSTSVSTTAPYAFGTTHPQVSGVDQTSGVASFATNNSISGTSDDNSTGTVSSANPFTDNYSAESVSTAGTIGPTACTVGTVGSTGCQIVFYVISPTRAVLVELLNGQSTAVNPAPAIEIADQ
jgi:uncharacterized repeat protein (TIGR01451 family)